MVYVIQVCWQQDQDDPAISKPVWRIPLLCVQWKTPDDGQRNSSKHVEFRSKNKNLEKLMHLVGSIIRNLSRWTVRWTSNHTDVIRYHIRRRLIYYKAMLTHNSRVFMHRESVVSHIYFALKLVGNTDFKMREMENSELQFKYLIQCVL